MPKTTAGAAWEIGFRGAVRAALPGWTVSERAGRIQVRVRPAEGKAQSAVLPLDWSTGSLDKTIRLLNRAAKIMASGQTDSLKDAITAAQGASTTMKPALNWPEVSDGLRSALIQGRNEILPKTWVMNYKPFVDEALGLLAAGKASDGHALLKLTLRKWEGKPPSRAACCIALRNLTDHAIARHHAARCWQITALDIKELRGKAAKRRRKATLSDTELQFLIGGIESRNPGWANVIRLLTLLGLRPIELQHLVPNRKEDGSLGLWCSYEKTCGSSQTEQRQLEPCWLQDIDGSPIRWKVIEQFHAGRLELPLGNDGKPRKLNGHYVEQFLRIQPEWAELKTTCADRGEWLRGYSFRDSFSLRCHRQKIELGAICAAMGHNIEAHGRAYRWESATTTSAAFAAAYAEAV
jgi:hypothetical protein